MANRYFQQFFFSLNHAPTYLECAWNVGATGAVSGLTGSGVLSVTRKAAGVYQIALEDTYSRYLGGHFNFTSAVNGTTVNAGSLVTGTLYSILTVGNTNWVTAGVPANVTPQVGTPFVAAAAGSGTGSVKPLISSGVEEVNVSPDPQLTVTQKFPYLLVTCYNSSGTAADPVQGSRAIWNFMVRNSSVKGKGE